MKVYVVIEQNTCEFEVETYTNVFSTREKAEEFWKNRAEDALSEAQEHFGVVALLREEVVVERNNERLYLDIYLDGRASEWDANIWVEEKEIDN